MSFTEEEFELDDPRGDLEWRIQSTAEWRQRKAVQYPEDVRNEAAANTLMALLTTELSAEGTQLYAKIGGAPHKEGEIDAVSSTLADVGFRFHPKTLDELVYGII